MYQNYAEFVVISREISQLEGDMLALHGLMNEIKEINDGLKMIEHIPEGEEGYA